MKSRSAELVREYLRAIGKMGGESKSQGKVEAARRNVEKARMARAPQGPPRGAPIPKIGGA